MRHVVLHPFTRRCFAGLALAACAALVTPAIAAAWEYPLLPHVPALAFSPSSPDDQQPVEAIFSAAYPGECWRLASATAIDSAHVTFTLVSMGACADSVSGWTQVLTLGRLAAGAHTLAVHADVIVNGVTTPEDITVPFDVGHGGPPPPASGDSVAAGIQYWQVLPSSPGVTDPVTLVLHGRFAFDCGEIVEATQPDASTITLRLRPGAACADTTHEWERPFALGVWPAGVHVVAVTITDERPGGTRVDHVDVGFTVADPNPPAPVDSLPGDSALAGMSSARPNPFHEESRFSVTIPTSQGADVAVFDLGGRRVVTVYRGMLPAGTSELAWNGRRADGSRAPGGIYFYRLAVSGHVVTRRVVLLGAP